MPSSLQLPSRLNLIFHGPWGFLVGPNRIYAASPNCHEHTFLMGDTPVLMQMPSGAYHFAGAALQECGDPVNKALQTTVTGKSPDPSGWEHNTRCFILPPATLRPGYMIPRDGALTGDLSCLNSPPSGGTVYIAVNQVLAYTCSAPEQLELVGSGGSVWMPAPKDNLGRLSINFHLFAQDIASRTSTGGHFAHMAHQLFGLRLELTQRALETTFTGLTSAIPWPQGISDDDLGDLGKQTLDQKRRAMCGPFPAGCSLNLIANL